MAKRVLVLNNPEICDPLWGGLTSAIPEVEIRFASDENYAKDTLQSEEGGFTLVVASYEEDEATIELLAFAWEEWNIPGILLFEQKEKTSNIHFIAERAQAKGWMKKPFNRQDFVQCVQSVLGFG